MCVCKGERERMSWFWTDVQPFRFDVCCACVRVSAVLAELFLIMGSTYNRIPCYKLYTVNAFNTTIITNKHIKWQQPLVYPTRKKNELLWSQCTYTDTYFWHTNTQTHSTHTYHKFSDRLSQQFNITLSTTRNNRHKKLFSYKITIFNLVFGILFDISLLSFWHVQHSADRTYWVVQCSVSNRIFEFLFGNFEPG